MLFVGPRGYTVDDDPQIARLNRSFSENAAAITDNARWVKELVGSGEIPGERIDMSCRRIPGLKMERPAGGALSVLHCVGPDAEVLRDEGCFDAGAPIKSHIRAAADLYRIIGCRPQPRRPDEDPS